MNVFYTTNDAFVPQVAASVCSLLENNRDADNITVYVASAQVSDENKRRLTAFAQSYGRTLHVIEIGDIRSYLDFDVDTLGWSNIVLARLVLDRLLPQEVERVLYLDGDTIVADNLRELWDTDMDGCAIAASIEPTVAHTRRHDLDMGEYPYFNSGVLLIDLKRWRAEQTGKQILDYYRERGGKLFAPDQDAINGALAGRIHVLSPRYNFYNIFYVYPYRTLQKIALPMPYERYVPQEMLEQAKRSPAILHYLGEERPWRKNNTHKYADVYKRYLSMTPWQDTPDEEGWGTYFLCFKIFNAVTKPFPMLRYKIIDSLIPAFMRRRAKQLKKANPAK